MNLKSRKNGISLISLIITIIVVIILAAIVIFSGMDTPEKAQLSKVISDIDNVQTAVDQAYYGLYTEKAVAGEVWTQSQFYEAVAKGITNRDELSGDTGIIKIEDTSLASINLPEYEGRVWGIALEDIDETTKVGNVVLAPGFESNGKIYSTLLDTQNGGRDNQLTEGIKTNIEVKNLRITTDSNGSTVAGTGITEGTTLYINFDASENGQRVEVSPSLPYAVTENGEYNFSLASTSGSAKTYTVTVSNYKEVTLADMLQVGDYIKYKADSNNSYTLRASLTGYSHQDGTVLTPQESAWRVWKIESNKVIIMPTSPVNAFVLRGSAGFVNSVDIINDVCKMYANEAYGVSSGDIRSLTIEDLEEVSNLPEIRDAYSNYGKTNAEINGNSGYESGTFYTESDGKTINKDGIVASSTNPVILKQTFYRGSLTWKSIENSKFASDTYGTLLGDNRSWMASPCVSCYDSVYFHVHLVNSWGVDTDFLYISNGDSNGLAYWVRPLVTLSSKLQIDTSDTSRDGKSTDTAWKIMLKE